MAQKILWLTPPQHIWQAYYQPHLLNTLFDTLYDHVSSDITIILLVQKEQKQVLALLPKTMRLITPMPNESFLVQKNDTYVSILFEHSSTTLVQQHILSDFLQ